MPVRYISIYTCRLFCILLGRGVGCGWTDIPRPHPVYQVLYASANGFRGAPGKGRAVDCVTLSKNIPYTLLLCYLYFVITYYILFNGWGRGCEWTDIPRPHPVYQVLYASANGFRGAPGKGRAVDCVYLVQEHPMYPLFYLIVFCYRVSFIYVFI